MFAVIKSGGKQYKVSEGDVVQLELLKAAEGDIVELPVMMIGADDVKIGTPFVEGASVKAEVLRDGRGKKIYLYKYKAKNKYRRKIGHRQSFTEVRINEIKG